MNIYKNFNKLNNNSLLLNNLNYKIVFSRSAGQFQRPKILTKLNDDFFESFEQNNLKNVKNETFKNLRSNLMNNHSLINEINVDSIILGNLNRLSSQDQLDLAKKYVNFLRNENKEINSATFGKLLRYYYQNYNNSECPMPDQEEILKIYNEIITKNPILDSITCENLIYGLILTNEWKDSLKLLDMIKITCTPNLSTLSCIATKAFRLKSIELGWEILEEIVKYRKQPKCEIFIEYLNVISENELTFVENLEKILKFIELNDLIVSKNVIDKLQECLSKFNYQNDIVILNKKGQCSRCGSFLERIQISTKEFKMLRDKFFEKVMLRKDIFLRANPTELNKFTTFIENQSPFHCVIDGLNVAYSSGMKAGSIGCANILSNVVKYFEQKNKHVLVIGRKHMHKWPKEQFNYIKTNTKMFLVNDLSQDDPFLLYAALKSGPNTDFFSRDLMRSHSHFLGPDLKIIFKKWQLEHQFSLKTMKNDKIFVKEPIKHNIYAHKVNNIWHMPFKNEYRATPEEIFETPDKWLCFSLKN